MTIDGGDTPPSSPRRHDASRQWNATDEHGYFYRDPRCDGANPFFAKPLRDYVLTELGRPVSVLQAGCLAPLRELGIGDLGAGGFDISVTLADEDTPLTQQVISGIGGAYDNVLVGDLRTAPIRPRAFDVVYCGYLLERVRHVELVLDHLGGALRPGGLLMIRMRDRRTAPALLDRHLPGPLRKAIWKAENPGVPGPFPAVYEKSVSERGIYSYALMRGLVIVHHEVLQPPASHHSASHHLAPHHLTPQHSAKPTTQANRTQISSSVRTVCGLISWLTRGRFGDDHDELLYVIRKPHDRFARVV